MDSYGDLLARWADHAPRATALVDERGAQSHAELQLRASALSRGLAGLGVGNGDVVAVWLPNMREWVETAFAAAELGAIVLGVNTKLRAKEVEGLLRESAAKVLITRPGFKGIDFLGMLEAIDPTVLAGLSAVLSVVEPVEPESTIEQTPPPRAGRFRHIAYEDMISGIAGEPRGIDPTGGTPIARGQRADPESPVHAFTSSGSTGRPKLILHSQRGLLFHADAAARSFGFNAGDAVILGALPLCGVFGFNTLLAGLAAGRPVILQPAFSAVNALELIQANDVTHLTASDTMLRLMLDAIPAGKEDSYGSWREAAFGNFTAGNPQDIIDAGTRLSKKFFQTYGSSEVMALVTYPAEGSGPERWVLGGGQPISAAINIRIRDVDGRQAPLGGQGEIYLKGKSLAVGLLRDGVIEPVLKDDDGYFGTGDLGYLLSSRDVVYLSRLGDALRIGGFLVSPREVEEFLESLPHIEQAQYVAVDSDRGLVPVAFVTSATVTGSEETDILAACVGQIAAFKTPKRVIFVEGFPVISGANGDKIDRKLLRAMAADALDAQPICG